MNRLIFKNKTPSSLMETFKKLYYLKNRFKLMTSELIQLYKAFKKQKYIIIQPINDNLTLNKHLELCYFKLKELDNNIELTEISQINSLVPLDKYNLIICDWYRGYKFFISNDIRCKN